MRLTGTKRFIWAGTKAGFRIRMVGWDAVREESDAPTGLLTLVARQRMARVETDDEKAAVRRGQVRLAAAWFAPALVELGQVVKAIRSRGLRSLDAYPLTTAHISRYAPEQLADPAWVAQQQALLLAKPIGYLPPYTVQMADGWYAVYGIESGPFPSKRDASVALAVMAGRE